MGSPDRITRVNEILRREIADLIERYGFKDGTCLISVTGVRVSSDLRNAAVEVSVFGGGPGTKGEALAFLRQHRCDLQQKIARDVTLKYTPVLHFTIDNTIEEGDRVLAMINEIEKDDAQ